MGGREAAIRRTSADTMMTASPTIQEEQCCRPYCRLVGTLTLHTVVILAEVFAIFFFAMTGNTVMTVILIAPFVLSGILCIIAAWHADTPHLGRSGLPLKQRPWPLMVLLAIPLGLFQGVIPILEIEEFYSRRQSSITSSGGLRQRFNDVLHDHGWLNKFHCKAVYGVFEDLVFAGVVFFGYLGAEYPPDNPITKLPDGWDPDMTQGALQIVLWICFTSVGLCLLELDSAVSPRRVRKKMKSSWKYEAYHYFFRVGEVVSRWSLLISFLVLTRRRLDWWWAPMIFELVLSVFLVDFYGGCEVTMLVRIMCAVPCIFADVFRFVDSPYKRRAAQKLSRAFVVRNLLETIALPALYLFNATAREDARTLACAHHTTLAIALLSHPVYWFSLWCKYSSSKKKHREYRDIFSACESGELKDVMAFTSEARFGINMNIFDIDGKTPLMLAVQRCSAGMQDTPEAATAAGICGLLVEEGARVDLPIFEDNRFLWKWLHKPMRRRWTALHLAAWKGCYQVVEALVESERNFGASFASGSDASSFSSGSNYIDKCGETPMHIAAGKGHADIVRLFMSTWPGWAILKNRRGKTPMDVASLEEVQRVLHEGATDNGETPLLPSNEVALGSSSRRVSDAQNWQSVRLPIFHNFRDKGGPCRAPGLSSYVASIGGGALGKAFLVDEIMLQTIDENSILSTVNDSLLQSGLRRPDVLSNSIATGSWSGSESLASVPESPRAKPAPMLEDLEPIDSSGDVIEIWRDWVQNAERQGQPLGAYAFQFLDQRCVIGTGSFGIVWRAHDRTTKVKYAVKNMRSQRDEASSLAQRELDMSNHVSLQPHPCIVAFHQIFSFPGFFMIVMEFCPRGDLLDQIREARRAVTSPEMMYEPPALSQRWIGQIFLALEHLHLKTQSMLRDLKPENVVLSDRGIAKLTDFGFGRGDIESPGTWSFGMPPGSPGYIAPESLLQQQYDYRTDLYSYGVVIWVLLTGGVKYDKEPRPPLGAKNSRTDYMAHANDWHHLQQCIQHPEKNQACPLPANVVELVTNLTQKRQADRPLHPEIRQYEFLQKLGLPDRSDSLTAVNAWLAASEDGSSSSRAPASASSSHE